MATQYRQRAPIPVETAPVDDDYDYETASQTEGGNPQDLPTPTPTSASAQGMMQNLQYTGNNVQQPMPSANQQQSEEALLDLAQLEELHQEAEKMKALGNKHMAAQVC